MMYLKFISILLILPFFNFTDIEAYKFTYYSESKLEIMGKKITLSSDVNVYATKEQTVITHSNLKSDSKSSLEIEMPDSILFVNLNWYNVTDGIRTQIPFDSVSISATKEYRKICSFNCQKFILKNYGKEYECWICKDLPSTITPLPSVIGFSGALLECKEKNSEVIIKLKSIYFIAGKLT